MENEQQVNEETSQTSEAVEPENESQETEVEQTQVEQTDESSEQVEEVVPKSEYDKQVRIAENQRIRAEKAEKKAKETKPGALQQFGTAPNDLYALLQAQVPQEDVAEVTDYAKLKGISVAEALQSSVVKNILAEKAENRKVAAATNVSTTRRNSGKVSDETLLETAHSKGELPDSDADIQRVFTARQRAKGKKAQ